MLHMDLSSRNPMTLIGAVNFKQKMLSSDRELILRLFCLL